MHSGLRLRWPLSPLIYQAVIKHLSISDQQSYCPSAWPCLARFTLFFPLGQVFINFDKLLPNLEFQENYHWIEYINSYQLVFLKSGERDNAFNYSKEKNLCQTHLLDPASPDLHCFFHWDKFLLILTNFSQT